LTPDLADRLAALLERARIAAAAGDDAQAHALYDQLHALEDEHDDACEDCKVLPREAL